MSFISHLPLDNDDDFPSINKKTSRHPKQRNKWSLLWFIPKEILNRKDEITDYKGKAIKNGNREGFFFYNRLTCNICRISFHTNGGLVDHQQEIHNKHSPSVRSRTILRMSKAGVITVSIVNAKDSEEITDLPSKSVAIKFVKEISWSLRSNVQTRPGISGDVGMNKTVGKHSIRTPDTNKSSLDSLNLAISSESKSNDRFKLMDEESDQNGQEEPSTLDQQKPGETIVTSSRGPGRGISLLSNVLRGQGRGRKLLRGRGGRGRKSLEGFESLISSSNSGKSNSLTQAHSSYSDSDDCIYYSNQLIDDKNDEDYRKLKSPSKVDNIRSFGLDSGNTDQQKLRDTFKMSTRGCSRLLSRHVLRGQTRVGGRSPWRFRGRISMGGDVDRGRIDMEIVRGRVSGYQRCIGPLSRGSRNLRLMRSELCGQRLSLRNQNYASTVNNNRSHQRPKFQSESSTFETRINETQSMIKDFEGRLVVKQEEPEMIDLTEEPTIDRLKSYGISVSRFIVAEKEVQLPDYINLPSSITVTQPTPRPDCSSRQSF